MTARQHTCNKQRMTITHKHDCKQRTITGKQTLSKQQMVAKSNTHCTMTCNTTLYHICTIANGCVGYPHWHDHTCNLHRTTIPFAARFHRHRACKSTRQSHQRVAYNRQTEHNRQTSSQYISGDGLTLTEPALAGRGCKDYRWSEQVSASMDSHERPYLPCWSLPLHYQRLCLHLIIIEEDRLTCRHRKRESQTDVHTEYRHTHTDVTDRQTADDRYTACMQQATDDL